MLPSQYAAARTKNQGSRKFTTPEVNFSRLPGLPSESFPRNPASLTLALWKEPDTATTIQVLDSHHFGTIRTVNDGGRVLFYGKDVATALGYKDPANALKLHCKGVPKHHPLETPGGIQQFRFITEGDLYRLVASSKLPAAERFESWVFDEVLPSIRRHGIYAIDELLHNDEFLEEAIRTLRGERLARLAVLPRDVVNVWDR